MSTTSFSVVVGGEVDVFFQNIGPGNFVVPPTISSAALAFLDETTPEIDPGGITQLFHFRGISTGTTVITFQHTCGCTPVLAPFAPYSVTDTVMVY